MNKSKHLKILEKSEKLGQYTERFLKYRFGCLHSFYSFMPKQSYNISKYWSKLCKKS